GFPMDIFQYYNLGLGSSVQAPGSSKTEWTLVSYLGRVNYSLLNKYLVTASIRTDGDSKFGKNNKYGVFPSVSLAWQLAEESFIKNMEVFSQLKLRASYGKTGNEAIGVYRSLSLLGTSYGTRSSYIYGTTNYPIAFPQNIANPDLSWEKTGEFNIGLDMGIFKDRLNMTLDYYYKKTTDLLLNVPVPNQTGFGSVLQNTGAMLNKGVEIGINSTNFEGKFSWNTNFNISFNKNTILSLGGAPYIYSGWVGGGNVAPHDKNTARLQPGHSVGEFYGSIYEGIWQTQEEIIKVGTMPSAKPGDIRYKDVNNDGKYDTENDDVFLGNPNPDFSFGFTNDFTYNNWNLHVFMYGSYGNSVLNLAAQQLALDGLGPSAKRLDMWSSTNPKGAYPSARVSNPQRVSSILVEDGSFLRIQNISLGYNLPVKGLLNGNIFRSARLGIGVDNLAIFTKYTGYDPEVNAYGNSNASKGMDRFGYPPSRIFSFNVALGF
ncbi:MAG: SusC/RagA family TonB-linked outer membrane protein, partial [Chitinophagaceae bacterium]